MSKLGRFSRTTLLLGDAAMDKLAESTVAVFGIGGVGSYAVEGLARAGVGHIVLIDNDSVCLTNINRQLHATTKTVGQKKTDAMKDRILAINPKAVVDTIEDFYLPENADRFFGHAYDYVIDAVDTVTAKIDLVLACEKRHIPIICSMGAGNKLDPTQFEVTDIYKTSVDPIARVMRKKLKAAGIRRLPVVYSKERPIPTSLPGGCGKDCICPPGAANNCEKKRSTPGSISFVPSVAGLILAGYVVRALTGIQPQRGA